jgi:protoheme IX farnesyltransferase
MLWALGLLAAQIALGAWLVLARQSAGAAWYSALHLSLSLLILAGLVVSTVLTFYPSSHTSSSALVENTDPSPFTPLRSLFTSTFTRLSLLTLAAFFLLLVSGALVAASGAGSACSGWPLCLPLGPAGWLSLGHRLVVLGTALLLGVLFWRAWLTQRSQPVVLVATTSATVLFFAQALMGARLVAGYPAYLLALHQATAVAAWAALIVQIIAVGLAGRTVEAEQAEASTAHGRKGLVRDFLMLTKPIVVALLLVTTFAGMVIGARSLPPLSLAFWTLLGGFMAAGGSGAINQYIDRFDDVKMQRTQKRPIPAGRLSPAEGLAFGVGMALASFYLVAAMVNLLAALLTLAGIVYYVLIYSLLLKKTTVQNIVIGGGAGAIPPLVGWAAATGGLNIPSLFLFAVVFMWTPPHFWALALVRRVDYARAGVPMLPVVRGEAETRWQIFLYTLELVGLTLLLPLFGLGGSVYLVGAGVLGGWLLLAAWKVWKQGGNKVAWKMYRYSSMYLAFLFVVLMLDALI